MFTLATAAFSFVVPLATRHAGAALRVGPPAVRMADVEPPTENFVDEYFAKRGQADLDAAEALYRQSKNLDENLDDEFDGGDSGSGAVGDGNVDLEDQHNSVTLGALRDGVSDVQGASMQVGRGNVRTLDDKDIDVKGDTEARTASAGKNYFGRSTGLADKFIEEITDDQIKNKRMDKVRAQQKENWINQRAIHNINRAQGQGVVFGEETGVKPSSGGYIARESLSSGAWRSGAKENEISQKDLANHLEELASQPAARLDGEEWGELTAANAQSEETFEVRASPRQTEVVDIKIKNDMNTFAPFRCGLLPGSSSAFTSTPEHGTMNRRSGDDVSVVVRYTPQETGVVMEATLVFETEDMKKVYKFIGST